MIFAVIIGTAGGASAMLIPTPQFSADAGQLVKRIIDQRPCPQRAIPISHGIDF